MTTDRPEDDEDIDAVNLRSSKNWSESDLEPQMSSGVPLP